MAVGSVRDKPVEQRWRPATREGWLWKGDTSSDEMTGHFYALPIFYDLVADEQQKADCATTCAASWTTSLTTAMS